MACVICGTSNPEPVHLGCDCRSDTGVAHVECMVRVARAGRTWRACRACHARLAGPMLHRLSAYFTNEGDAVCALHQLARELSAHQVPIIRLPVNDQTCFRIRLPSHHADVALSVAAHTPKGQSSSVRFHVARIDRDDRVVPSSVEAFDAADGARLLRHVRAMLR